MSSVRFEVLFDRREDQIGSGPVLFFRPLLHRTEEVSGDSERDGVIYHFCVQS